MLFYSLSFFIFFGIYLLANFLIPKNYKIYLIIIGSTFFYSYKRVEDIWIPFFLAIIGFYGGNLIHNHFHLKRKLSLIFTLIILYLPLLFYKYKDFIYNDLIVPIFGLKEQLFYSNLPLGISFITFTVTSYLFDIYRKKFYRKISLQIFLAYILFFPQLIAGPILRPHELIPQLRSFHNIKLNKIIFAFSIFTIGIVKKIIFADTISKVVEPVFNSNIDNLNFLEILIGIYGFTVQIYCDFSGYSDMAVGLGLILGINLPINFLKPYTSKSLKYFWRKWHISLSTFLKDYLYIPLGGNRVILIKQIKNIFITMVLGGLWHGANWSFIFWGLLHGLGLSFLKIKERFLPKVMNFHKYINIFLTFNFVSFSWIFFRSSSIKESLHIMSSIFKSQNLNLPLFLNNYSLEIILILFFLITHRYDDHQKIENFLKSLKIEILIPILIIIWLVVISFSSSSSNAFIYFDF